MEKIRALKNQKWVIGVSGGCDSMALLHMCIKAGVKVVIAHVNYKKRETADRDMEGVKTFARQYQIPCFVMQVENYKHNENFQKQAREIRYQFYKKCMEENDCEGVLVAHHKDDVIETYLMQKKSHRDVSYYGIKDEVILYDMRVKRLLLNYSKTDLIQYCNRYGIRYYEDESNFSDVYERNRIRHHIVEKMSNSQKTDVIREIDERNKQMSIYIEKANEYLMVYKDKIEVGTFSQMEKEVKPLYLRFFIRENTNIVNISKKALMDMIYFIETHKKTNQSHTINDIYDLHIEYGVLSIHSKKEEQGYCYVLEKIEYLKTPYFTLSDQGRVIEGVTVKENDFPLCIRAAKSGDEIKLRMGTKKVRRFFIDNKIAHKERKIWPVIENKDGKVIFVSGIGCDIYHYSNNSSFFVLK